MSNWPETASAAMFIDDAVQETNFAAAETSAQPNASLESAGNADGLHAQRYGSWGSRSLDAGFSPNSSRAANEHGSDARSPRLTAKEESPARALAPDLLRGLLMALMALDHDVMALNSWPHGQARETENDSLPVRQWNRPIGYVIRTLTHLCAPGFNFLLGLGVVYFGRSRTRLGWSSVRLIRHFLIRAAILTLLCVLEGLILGGGELWFLNIVLFALAVDYVIVGLLWLVCRKTEAGLTRILFRWLHDDSGEDVTQPLLAHFGKDTKNAGRANRRAAAISWHVHNTIFLVLAGVAAWCNIWMSPTHGQCHIKSTEPVKPVMFPESAFLRIWFFVVQEDGILSYFPPLAWLSFPILGLLYGRLTLVRPMPSARLNLGTLMAALAFLVLFVLTRILRFGNLSEDCLQMPEHLAHPDANPELVSVPSFFYLIKYPPDVAFLAFTMGVNLLLLATFGAIPPNVAGRLTMLLAYGTSALFFYLVHQIILFAIGSVLKSFLGHGVHSLDLTIGKPNVGVDSLWAYFGTWAVTLAILYPLCTWYSRFKQKKSPDSVWRFF